MKESQEQPKSGREILLNLENEDKYVFHGSETSGIEIFEPRQAYTFIDGKKEKDDEPAIHASEFADIAILMAMINKENCEEGFSSGFSYEDKVVLRVDKKGLDQLTESSEGYVYVFLKEDFKQRFVSELILHVPVKPLMMITVKKSDLSGDLEVVD